MDIKQITPRYSVTPQITPEDLTAIKAAGFTTVICNRPNSEIPPELQSEAIAAAAQAAGLNFHVLELTHQTMTPENVATQHALIESAPGTVLAYCASGTRCSVIWALGEATQGTSPDAILQTTADAGYALDQLRPALTQLSEAARS